ncbi:hypothetical protein ACRXCV_00205 (plasmid) [Halobacteriovorax sp. GFR7]|uniref:DUF7940 domain-containing protein n=1 Tax=unclassified Halobacteriovorax TaxID=2639665 RepID=UPI003D96D16B
MKLIDNWKSALKMHTVQLALVYTIITWYNTLVSTGLPETVMGWVNALIGLFFIALRVVAQPELHAKGYDVEDEHENNSVG